jgi:hypothetical protein
MDDQQPKKKPLSEIGHLFLSDVRDRHMGGQPRPQRTPPGGQVPPAPPQRQPSLPRGDLSIDLTPEEFAQVFGAPDGGATAAGADVTASARRNPPITAIIGEHLNGKQFTRVKEYARHLAAREGRVGLIELDASEFRLMCFEPAGAEALTAAAGAHAHGSPAGYAAGGAEVATETYDPRAMAEAIEEMNFDVDRWLLLIPGPRVPEAQPLLALADHWVLLTTCDHDGVVASYRTLKGLSAAHRPRTTLSVLDAVDEAQAGRVYGKLAGVCQQFLNRSLEADAPVRRTYGVAEHLVMLCRPTRDKAQLANPPQWAIVEEFLARAKSASADAAHAAAEAAESHAAGHGDGADSAAAPSEAAQREFLGDVVVTTLDTTVAEVHVPEPIPVAAAEPAVARAAVAPAPALQLTVDGGASDVLDLPTADATAEQIVNAVLHQDGTSLLECPVRPPMCADARLAVTRDRGVVMLAVAGRGLNDLRTIGLAYRWLVENRSLIGMAVPQLAIDPAQAPRLRLLVDRRDANAEVLQPMLGGGEGHVTVQAYRRLKWGQKAGLLLEAA